MDRFEWRVKKKASDRNGGLEYLRSRMGVLRLVWMDGWTENFICMTVFCITWVRYDTFFSCHLI